MEGMATVGDETTSKNRALPFIVVVAELVSRFSLTAEL
jgi:hypothetical protein